MRIEVTTPNLQSVLHELSRFPASVGRKHFRIALNAAAGVTKSAIANNLPRDTGAAKRSLKIKVVIPDFSYNLAHHGKPARAVVGASRSAKRRMMARGRYRSSATQKFSTSNRFRSGSQGPASYLHLVESGTRSHVVDAYSKYVLSNGKKTFGTRVVNRARPQRPFSRAFSATKDHAGSKALQKLAEGIVSEAALAYARTQLSATRQLSRKIVNTAIRAFR